MLNKKILFHLLSVLVLASLLTACGGKAECVNDLRQLF